MSTIIITKDILVKKRGSKLSLYKGTEKVTDIIPTMTKNIISTSNTGISSDIVKLCNGYSIGLHFIDGRGAYQGSLMNSYSNNTSIRLAQYRVYSNQDLSNTLALSVIKGKTTNQKWLLNSIDKKIDFRLISIKSINRYEELLGMEGCKAKQYFSYWDSTLIKNKDFKFEKRTKRPPENPLNALLSLCYTLLTCEVHSLCLLYKLDPYIGFFHKIASNRPSLVCDLIEPYRPLVDKFVLNIINRKELSLTHFDEEFRLTKEGYPLLIKKWFNFLKVSEFFNTKQTLYTLIDIDIKEFARVLGSGESYNPLNMLIECS